MPLARLHTHKEQRSIIIFSRSIAVIVIKIISILLRRPASQAIYRHYNHVKLLPLADLIQRPQQRFLLRLCQQICIVHQSGKLTFFRNGSLQCKIFHSSSRNICCRDHTQHRCKKYVRNLFSCHFLSLPSRSSRTNTEVP